MPGFTYQVPPARVVFAAGALERAPAELDRLGCRRVLLIATGSQQAARHSLVDMLGARLAGVIAGAVMHVPLEHAEAARAEARAVRADGLLALGGGSAIGLAKAVALDNPLPILAIPTTYAGSEMTPIWGLTEAGAKRTGRAANVLPKTVIYDPDLTIGLPPRIAGPSGLNALAHCVEALYAANVNPVMALLAEEGIRVMAGALPAMVGAAPAASAREAALYGAMLAGMALATATMGIHHKLCHVLGGSFGLPHAETHAVILPYATAFNADAAPAAMAAIGRALGVGDAPRGLFDLAAAVGAPRSLAALGLAAGDIGRAARIATAQPYDNPRAVDEAGVRLLLEDALRGALQPSPARASVSDTEFMQ
jgi:maleylacetate reductase